MDRFVNPYLDQSMRELWQACQNRASDLLNPGDRQRSREERQRLDIDTAQLLMTIAKELHPGEVLATIPEAEVTEASPRVADAFLRHHAREAYGLRYKTLNRAADFVLGAARHDWVAAAEIAGKRLHDVALGSDEGLRLALNKLEKEQRAKR